MGVLREELRRNLKDAGALAVGFANLERATGLPFPAMPCAVAFRAPKAALEVVREHARATLRRYGYKAEPAPDNEEELEIIASAAHLGEGGETGVTRDGQPQAPSESCTGAVFTDAPFPPNKH